MSRKQNLAFDVLHRGVIYPKGNNREVPDHFPKEPGSHIKNKLGDRRRIFSVDVEKEERLAALREAPKETVDMTDDELRDQALREELRKKYDGMGNREKLIELAATQGIEVTGTGKDGYVTKDDVIAALINDELNGDDTPEE